MIIKVQRNKSVHCMVECAFFVWRRPVDSGVPRWNLEIHSMSTKTHKASATPQTGIEIEASVHISVYDGDTVIVMNNEGKIITVTKVSVIEYAERMRQLVARGYRDPDENKIDP